MRAWYFQEDHPELLQDFPNPPECFPDKFKALATEFQPPFTWIFIGPQGAFSPLHRDIWYTCAWMAQFQGRKRFLFVPPKDLKLVYRKLEDKEEYLDLRAPDLERFPSYRHANFIEAVLEPGDLLYIPSRWPHFVECLTDSVSLTSNFANVVNFKHVLIPYTRWLEKRQAAIQLMKGIMKMQLRSSGEDGEQQGLL
ncbi:hypothetical protein GUITHDRAFT_73345 [Guillardia theta CCMP2712]|uniref:JmjC domain-containing protein n=1 Tax=Guillardia theta (strain CCMP2712) TaxID=905079 RepID=L1J3R4_GUITC|nr:hypothetical protein GUITHDRAFT_73345 [Guillardia theta CCMP2712]EKX43168.1 hypothetical protein GUITHDRAFT_73345 [Guillardia theta CCMP2712]|eukprot:XP_005830148.1 hypothetical protein GUITHDRAFT_73345 [Guillardia theta CCMP2712]